VLGEVIERVSGKKYGDLLRERILDRLGMKDTGLDADGLVLRRRAQGYLPGKPDLATARGPSMANLWAAGSMYSTTGDLLKWENGLFGGKVLSAKSLKLMTTPGQGDYGLGIGVMESNGTKVIEHPGGVDGFNSFLMYAPERRIAVVVLSNVQGRAASAMPEQLLDVALGKPVTLPTERKAALIPKEALTKMLGTYNVPPTSSLLPPFAGSFPLKIAVAGDRLNIQERSRPPVGMMYLGEKDGRPHFFVPTVYTEVQFLPNASGSITELILHRTGVEVRAKRQ
jgi:hypothetical protein